MGRGPEGTFFQKRHTAGQKASENTINVTNN